MSYELTGTISVLNDIQVVNDRFKKREFVVVVKDGAYEQHIKLQTTQDRTDILHDCYEGQEVKVFFNLQGKPFTNREGKTMYFTNLNCWKIEKVGMIEQDKPLNKKETVIVPNDNNNDDGIIDLLPF